MLPTTSKAELVADQARNPPFGNNLTFPLELYTHVHQTSGTTGPPLRVLDTSDDWAWWGDCLAHSFRAAGMGASDRAALAFSFGPTCTSGPCARAWSRSAPWASRWAA